MWEREWKKWIEQRRGGVFVCFFDLSFAGEGRWGRGGGRTADSLRWRAGRTLRLITVVLLWRQTLTAAVLLKCIGVLLLRELTMVYCKKNKNRDTWECQRCNIYQPRPLLHLETKQNKNCKCTQNDSDHLQSARRALLSDITEICTVWLQPKGNDPHRNFKDHLT